MIVMRSNQSQYRFRRFLTVLGYRMFYVMFVSVSTGARLSAMWNDIKEVLMIVPITHVVCGWCGVALRGGLVA